MKQFFKGIINLKGDLYEKITNGEKTSNNINSNLKIESQTDEVTFKNGFKIRFSVSGFTSYKKNNIYVPINIIYKFQLLDCSKKIVTEKEFKINDIGRLLNLFSLIHGEIMYIVKVDALVLEKLKSTNNFDEKSLKTFVVNTKTTNDEMVNMCYMVLKNLKCVKSNELINIILNKIEKSGICSDNRKNFKVTIASLLATLVKKELKTNNHSKNVNDIIEFYYQRYFNSVA